MKLGAGRGGEALVGHEGGARDASRVCWCGNKLCRNKNGTNGTRLEVTDAACGRGQRGVRP